MSNRYIAQTRLPEIGPKGQLILSDSTVLIVGCGALGSPLAMTLAAAGVGHIILADFDTIELSNLQRQIFYQESEAGNSKAVILAEKLSSLNSEIKVEAVQTLVNRKWLDSLMWKPDMVADAADNPSTTYMLEKFCKDRSIPLSTAGVSGWRGQLYTWKPGAIPFSELIPIPPEDSGILPCSLAGIFGPTALLAASLQASEILKTLLGKGATFTDKIITFDLLENSFDQLGCEM